MAYYEDLSKFEHKGKIEKKTFSIGWIEDDTNFNKGKVSEQFIKSLFEYVKFPINPTRSIYKNLVLDGENVSFVACYNGYNILLGTAEIRVIDNCNDTVYAAPNLILHYVMNHNYLPPENFINAVIKGSKPNSTEYNKFVRNYYGSNTEKCNNLHCPACRSKRLYFAPKNLTQNRSEKQVQIINYDKCEKNTFTTDMYTYHAICMNCGRLVDLKYEEIMKGN